MKKNDDGQIEDIIYFSGKEVTEFLEYKKTDQAVRDLVEPEYKKTLNDILKLQNLNPLNFRGVNSNPLNFRGFNSNPPIWGGLNLKAGKKNLYIFQNMV